MTLKINFNSISSFIIILFIINSCGKISNAGSKVNTTPEVISPESTSPESTSPESKPPESKPPESKPPTITTNLNIEPSNTFSSLKLSETEFNYWNSNAIHLEKNMNKIKTLCKSEIYPVLKDDFDFIIVVMNNINLPTGMPYGQYLGVKNDIQGIGTSLFDSSKEYGSDGKLQGIYFLYKNNIDNGPIIHEMFHRWANRVVPQNYTLHWDHVKGILYSVTNNIADIELYLAGAIPASDIRDAESLAIYNDSRFTVKTRTPNSINSQKSFKSLIVVFSSTTLTNSEIDTFKKRITNITTHAHSNYQNLYNKSKGLMNLSIGDLDKSKK